MAGVNQRRRPERDGLVVAAAMPHPKSVNRKGKMPMNVFCNSLHLACPPLIKAVGVAALNLSLVAGALAQQSPMTESEVIAAKPANTGMADAPRPVSNDPFHTPDNDAMFIVDGAADKANPRSPQLRAGSFETVKDGYRRVLRTESITLSPTELAERIAAGKVGDLVGNRRVTETITDHLPANWMQGYDMLPTGMRVDSFGNPIVNRAQGLPDWAQRDVDALRDEIADWKQHLWNLDLALAGRADQIALIPPRATPETYRRGEQDLQTDRFESQHIIGNFIGQAFVRQIDLDNVMPLNDAMMSDAVVDSVAKYLHFYQSLKAQHAHQFNEPVEQAAYPTTVTTLLQSRGHDMQEVLALEDEGGIAGATGCYIRVPFAVGWTATVGGIGIWNGAAATVDDASADVPIGFRYYFQPCENAAYNTAVRVSTNGYITFFQQGGGTVDATPYLNTTLPSVIDPDGFAAPWWDDLEVLNLGTPDEVVYKTEGAVGFRTFTVEWWSMSHHNGGSSEFYYFQVKLLENYPSVQFFYDTLFSPDPTVDSRSSGIENFAGSEANCADNCTNTITGIPTSNFRFDYPGAPNDGCFSAICLEEDEPVFGSNFGAGGSDLSSCVSVDFPDVWYSYRAPIATTVTVSLCSGGNGYDSTLSVFNACSGTQLACDDDGCFSPSSTVNFNSVAGGNYLLRVSGYENSRGTFLIRVNIGAQGDSCFNPLPINIPGTGVNFYSTFDNTGCADDTTCAGNDTIDEWLTWTAPTSGVARASTCTGDTNFDTTLAVFSGVCGSLTQLACNDDVPGDCASLLRSRVLWNVDAGATYLIRLAGFNGASGPYDINLNYYVCPGDIAPLDTGDGNVNVQDLLAVIASWGGCSGCRADFVPPGGDNQVNVQDLLGVIGNWGCQ